MIGLLYTKMGILVCKIVDVLDEKEIIIDDPLLYVLDGDSIATVPLFSFIEKNDKDDYTININDVLFKRIFTPNPNIIENYRSVFECDSNNSMYKN